MTYNNAYGPESNSRVTKDSLALNQMCMSMDTTPGETLSFMDLGPPSGRRISLVTAAPLFHPHLPSSR